METITFDKLLLKTAFCCMASDGNIDNREVELIKKMCHNSDLFQNFDFEKEINPDKQIFLMWNDAEDEIFADSKKNQYHLPAPKMPLPGHAESYNPPAEYLMTEEEIQKYNELDPEDRPANFIPKKHDCLRHVAGYQNFIKERFERCLDLYLCPRKMKKRLNIQI